MRMIAHKQLALKPLSGGNKVESQMIGGVALVSQKINTITAELAMDFTLSTGVELKAGKDKVILHGDTAFQTYAKSIFNLNGVEFFRMPEDGIVGYIRGKEIDPSGVYS